ncbi:hypothetical protein V8J82_11490 [Gymnodinialimonas sp. 2305UL16-5]|uniref:hypothetical protein n=1 Tax=Gymnodinialimonas mytili TaxID=3126503 RepID=UPI0030A1C558
MTDKPFRFFDNRLKYLTFVNTTNEKWRISERVAQEVEHLIPRPPALRVFDAGMGDATVLSNTMRAMHQRHPNVPFYMVGKEISLEDLRLSLDKIPDRLVEHPASVVVMTNLFYSEAPWLRPSNPDMAERLVWKSIALEGQSSIGFQEQLRDLDPFLVENWQVRSSAKTGNPLYVNPTILVIYRRDHDFLLDNVIPTPGMTEPGYDLVLASQPWRARTDAAVKVRSVLTPLTRCLAPGGRMMVVQSAGNDPGAEIVNQVWPDIDLFPVNRYDLIAALKDDLGDGVANYDLTIPNGGDALLSYRMHTLPEEVGPSIGTSTLSAAWNAATYVAQIEDVLLEETHGSSWHFDVTADILHKYGGLWFNDEVFSITRLR